MKIKLIVLVLTMTIFFPIFSHAVLMKEVCKSGAVNLTKLTDALFAAFPSWIFVNANGENATDVKIWRTAIGICAIIPNDTDMVLLSTIYNTHDTTPTVVIAPWAIFKNDVLVSTNFSELRQAILDFISNSGR